MKTNLSTFPKCDQCEHFDADAGECASIQCFPKDKWKENFTKERQKELDYFKLEGNIFMVNYIKKEILGDKK